MAKLTPADVVDLRDQGHLVVDLGNGQVNVNGSVFRVIGGQRVVNESSPSVVDAGEAVHMDIGDFSIVSESKKIHGDL